MCEMLAPRLVECQGFDGGGGGEESCAVEEMNSVDSGRGTEAVGRSQIGH